MRAKGTRNLVHLSEFVMVNFARSEPLDPLSDEHREAGDDEDDEGDAPKRSHGSGHLDISGGDSKGSDREK